MYWSGDYTPLYQVLNCGFNLNVIYVNVQDLLNMFFRDIHKPIPTVYNLLLAMLWQHPENVDLDQVKVVHFCATVRCYLEAFCICYTRYWTYVYFFRT